jgi:hypothetical protein
MTETNYSTNSATSFDTAPREEVDSMNDSAESTFADAATPPEAAAMTQSAQQPDETDGFDFVGSVTRLVAGLVIEGGAELLTILQDWERENPPGQRVARLTEELSSAERMRYIALGLTVETVQRTRKITDRLTRLGLGFGQRWSERLRPLTESVLMRPARNRYEQLVARTEETTQRWLETGRFEESHGRALARQTVSEVVERVVGHLEYNETTQGLIRAQAGSFLEYLVENPDGVRPLIKNEVGAFLGELEGDPAQLDGLVQEVADRYISYIRENPALVQALIEEQAGEYLVHLQENPEIVQELIQDQSLGMAGEVMDEVRVRTVTVDTLMERLARGVLRRQPRSTAAPPEVRKLAEYTPVDESARHNGLHTEEDVA